MDLDTLFQAHYGRIARVISRVVRDQARAEELAVEVFVKWQRTPKAQGEQAEGWLYRTAAREAIDEWRKQARWQTPFARPRLPRHNRALYR